MQQAIELAIKGGWKGEGAKFNSYVPEFRDIHWYLADGYAENCSLEEALLDPAFFQACSAGFPCKTGVCRSERCPRFALLLPPHP